MHRILFVATDNLVLDALLNAEAFYDLYLFDDKGFASMVEVSLSSREEINLMMQYLFASQSQLSLIAKKDGVVIYDISPAKDKLVSHYHLESFYQEWLHEMGRNNNMDEYGIFLDVIGYLHRNKQEVFINDCRYC